MTAEPVAENELGPLMELVPMLVEIMYQSGGVGLAAPQLEISKRLFVMDSEYEKTKEKNHQIFFNPEIESTWGQEPSLEGCLSVPGLVAEVDRYQEIIVTAMDGHWNPVRLYFYGYPAKIVQHEIDHLDGVLFLDHLSQLKREMYVKKIKKARKKAGLNDS